MPYKKDDLVALLESGKMWLESERVSAVVKRRSTVNLSQTKKRIDRVIEILETEEIE